jgi:drug/metabolite transporter (DMT)-like permease
MSDYAKSTRVREAAPGLWAYWSGLLFVTAYNVLAAGNEVFVANRVQEIDPFLLLLLTFGACTAIFTATQARRLPRYLAMVRRCGSDVLLLNAVTAGTWIVFFVALEYLEPAVVSALSAAIAPVVMIGIRRLAGRDGAFTANEMAVALGILASMGLLAWATLAGWSGVGAGRPAMLLIGLPAAILAGLGIVLMALSAKRLYNRGWTAAPVMAVRFWMLDLVCAGVLAVTHRPVALPPNDVSAVLLIVTLGTVVPLYLFQLGMERLKPLQIALMISAGPLITLVLQAFDPRLHWSPFSVAGTAAATLLVAWSAIDGSPRTRAES